MLKRNIYKAHTSVFKSHVSKRDAGKNPVSKAPIRRRPTPGRRCAHRLLGLLRMQTGGGSVPSCSRPTGCRGLSPTAPTGARLPQCLLGGRPEPRLLLSLVLYQQSSLRTHTGAHGARRPERWGCEEQLKHGEWTHLQNVALKAEGEGDQVLPLQHNDAPR